MAPKIVDKEEKRMLIAHAAGQVFGDKGFERTRIDDIAAVAGVGKGTIYQYFKDKETLLEGSFEIMMSAMASEMYAALEVERQPLDTLKEIARLTVEAMEHMGHGYRFFLEYTLHKSRKDEAFPRLKEFLGQYRAGTESLLEAARSLGQIRSDVDVAAAAAAFAAWFDGAVFHWIILPEAPSLKEMADVFVSSFLAGIATDSRKGGRT